MPTRQSEYHRVCTENNKPETQATLELFTLGWEAGIAAASARVRNIDPLDGQGHTTIEDIAEFVEGLL